MIKTLNKLSIGKMYLNIKKAIYDKPRDWKSPKEQSGKIRNKRHSNQKEQVKFSLFADYVILSIKNPEVSTHPKKKKEICKN